MEKAFWAAITENEYKLPDGYTVEALTPELLSFLGSSEIDVRDPFGYMILLYWIVEYQYYSQDALRKIRDELLANLKNGLGEKDTDSVFLRSFSMLTLSLIAYYDLKTTFLSKTEINDLLTQSLTYLREEKDLRGFIIEKGWAHTAAHTADVLKFLARNPLTDKDHHLTILNGIAEKLLPPTQNHIYVHGEDERLATALLDVVKRDTLAAADWKAWLTRFTDWKKSVEQADFQPDTHTIRMNCKNLLRSLYIQIELMETMPESAALMKPDLLEAIKVMGLY